MISLNNGFIYRRHINLRLIFTYRLRNIDGFYKFCDFYPIFSYGIGLFF
jgi:hypothetical protein